MKSKHTFTATDAKLFHVKQDPEFPFVVRLECENEAAIAAGFTLEQAEQFAHEILKKVHEIRGTKPS